MELRITSTETIKPSSPTPDHLRTHKLSLLDQLSASAYFSTILFYSRAWGNTVDSSNHLKKSLSDALTHFYPFAGQLGANLLVDCDDRGVTFIEAHSASEMSEVIQPPNIDILERLLPCNTHEVLNPEHNLILQVNYFGCGGMAIGICFHHKIADGATAANFVKCWATVARGSNYLGDVIYNANSIFPAQNSLNASTNPFERPSLVLDSAVKRFKFDDTKIAVAREKFSNESCSDRPTSVTVVSAIILSAVIAAYRESGEFTAKHLTARVAVNLRKRIIPPLPEQAFGNICSAAALKIPMEEKIKSSRLAGELGQSIRMVDDQFVRQVYGDDQILLNTLKIIAAEKLSNNNKEFLISSWCKLPFYEADFGWGKPMSIGIGIRLHDVAVLVDSCDGKGIEAWVGLSKEEMARFEQHPDILVYTFSF